MCRITWGVIWIFQNGVQKFCMRTNIIFFTIIMSFVENKYRYFPGIQASCAISYICINVSVYFRRVLLSTWVIKKTWKCSLGNEWWHSFKNQRLNHIVLLYNCNCIRIMSINTFNQNIDIKWHGCIINSYPIYIKLWFLKTIGSHKY